MLARSSAVVFNAPRMSTPAARIEEPAPAASDRPVEIAGGGRYALCLEGLPFIGGGLVIAFLAGLLVDPLAAVPFLAFSAFATWFFRNPKRTPPADPDAIVCPADGVICQVADVDDVEHLGGKATRVSIFMSVFNVHVNRAPIAGRVLLTKHTPGKFAIASADKASLTNERNAIVLDTGRGRKLLFVQIAGSVARRIVCYAKPGDALTAGQRFGLIRFGSRVDVYFGADAKPNVAVGEKVVGGQTVLGRWIR